MGILETPVSNEAVYDRLKELKAFDETKAGVKGVVDSGIVKIPRIFVRPEDELANESLIPNGSHLAFKVPVINLEGIEKEERRKEIVDEILRASETWGFFQLVNHGIDRSILEEMIKGARRFHEQDIEMKKPLYGRDSSKYVKYNCNFDLFQTKAANWRDTFTCTVKELDDCPLKPEQLPETCRNIVLEYSKRVDALAHTVFELLSEALGLKPDHLKSMGCVKSCIQSCHYYPACPEPDLTMGTSMHSDPSYLTFVLQDGNNGGLQILHQNHWVDAVPVPGSFVVNIGDLLQLISNDKFKSVHHRVLASQNGPRISVASFYGTAYDTSSKLYGPIKELLSEDCPPVYKDILMKEYTENYSAKGLDGAVHVLDRFKF